MDLLTTKFVAMVILGLVSFLIAVSTLKFRQVLGLQTSQMKRRQTLINSILLCFGAGVLLATAMLHILPEVREMMEEKQESLGVEWLAEVVLCAGFLLVYLVEEVIHLTLHRTPHRERIHSTFSLREPANKTDSTVEESHDNDCHNDMEVKKERKHQDISPTTGHDHSHLPVGSSSPLRDFFTVLALSFHAVFEGMALGLEQDKTDVWTLFTAISVHKFVITFCVSLQILETGATMLVFFSYISTWILVTPLGIGVGMIISGMGTDELTSATLQGLAGGTILYVVMFEVLKREQEKEVKGIFQILGIIVGFCVMVVVQLTAHEPEETEENFDVGQNATLLHCWKNYSLCIQDKNND